MPKKKKQPARKRVPRTQPIPPPPPFDPNDPNAWLDHITGTLPPFIRSLCKSLYHERLLVRLPSRAVLCNYGMTSRGRVMVVDEDDPNRTHIEMPPQKRVLGDEEQAAYEAQVGQEDPNALGPGPDRNWWAWAVSAFRYAGGCKPESPQGADCWQIRHLYSLDGFPLREQKYHFTQSADLVAVHPVVQCLMEQYPCIAKTLQARVFCAFQYDPANQFASGRGPDNCGFV